MKNIVCIGTILNDYIIYKSKDESFKLEEKEYKEDILKLAELCNRDVSTFSFDSKKDIYKVLYMIDLNHRETILKSFLDNYYLTKYNLHDDFNEFLNKEIMIIPLQNQIKKLLKSDSISLIINPILELKSINEYIYNRLKNWINLEVSLANLNLTRTTNKLGKEYKNEFYFDLFENNNLQRNINLEDLKLLSSKFSVLKQADKLLNESLLIYQEIK